MTCKDCIHYQVCFDNIAKNSGNFVECQHFQDKSKFVELLCKVYEIGKTTFFITGEAEQALKGRENNA